MSENKKIMELLEELYPILENEGIRYAGEFINCKVEAEFKVDSDVDTQWCHIYKKKRGIYFFEIKFNSIDTNISKEEMALYLKNEWNLSERGSKPSIIKGKVEKYNIKNGDWIPFYIGKSRDLNDRVGQHIKFVRETKKTYALRLNELTSGIFKDADYRVRIIELDEYSGDKYWIVEIIESIIRNQINPICGRQ